MKHYQSTCKVLHSEYLNCSIYGNPKKRLVLEDSDGNVFTATTGTDHSCGYLSYYKNSVYLFTYHYTSKRGNIIITNAKEISNEIN